MKTEFVTLSLENNPAGNAELAGHRAIIKERAEKGYDFCGFAPIKFGPSGKMLAVDLVFQKLA